MIIANTLFRIVTPIDASEIEFWVGDPRVTLFTAPSDIVLEEFCSRMANGAIDLKNVLFFPVARILSRTFHLVIILSLFLSYCNGTIDQETISKSMIAWTQIALLKRPSNNLSLGGFGNCFGSYDKC